MYYTNQNDRLSESDAKAKSRVPVNAHPILNWMSNRRYLSRTDTASSPFPLNHHAVYSTWYNCCSLGRSPARRRYEFNCSSYDLGNDNHLDNHKLESVPCLYSPTSIKGVSYRGGLLATSETHSFNHHRALIRTVSMYCLSIKPKCPTKKILIWISMSRESPYLNIYVHEKTSLTYKINI